MRSSSRPRRLVGSRYARLTQFLCGPATTLAYVGDMATWREGGNAAISAITSLSRQ
jgi:hypothetical protein